jgi:uncharacterized protein (UPF0371 family)
MGVNMAGFAISDNDACCYASKQEIIRRYLKAIENERRNNLEPTESDKILLLMKGMNISVNDRVVYTAAMQKAQDTFIRTT